ncbi:MAG: hypothetical protein KGV44_03155 [Flavobacteriaceae bacterium]|nr:hypothetical protein [Flavobacteriaceae bacterium]
MLFRILSFLHFLWHSTNQHGVHSPFVYQLITKGLYVKTPKKQAYSKKEFGKTNRQQRKIIKKIFHYFNPTKKILTQQNTIFNSIYDCILFQKPSLSEFLKTLSYAHNDTVFIIKNPHKNQKNDENWNTLIENQKVIVSIDLYYIGLIFIRKEQLKQHFIIRS